MSGWNTPLLRKMIVICTFLGAAGLLLVRLGHYPLWDDEAQTALIAQGVWNTGDTSAIHGQNLVAYRNGLLIRDFKERASPPLQFYLAAPFVGVGGNSALSVRLPFTLLGLASIVLILRWACRDSTDTLTLLLLAIALLSNVSLLLYFRQARYYAPMILLSLSVGYSYWHIETRRGLMLHAILSVLLLASNYLAYGAWTAAMIVDYFIWGKRRRPIKGKDWVMLLGPQIVLGAVIVLIWNPLRISGGDPSSDHGWLADRFTLLWRTFRDADRCEFGCSALLLLAVPVVIWTRDLLLTRALIALIIAFLVIDFASPQSPRGVETADVRYFVSAIPLLLFITVRTLRLMTSRLGWLAILISPFAFCTNLLNASVIGFQKPRVTIGKYICELNTPVPDPYTAMIHWMDANIRSGQTVAVLPGYCTYPLMYHLPNAYYAWQLEPGPKTPEAFKHLPRINFIFQDAPDFLVCFGPVVQQLLQFYRPPPGVAYSSPIIVDEFWHDAYRPELMWRSFDAISPDKEHGTAIYIFRKLSQSVAPPEPKLVPSPAGQSDFHL